MTDKLWTYRARSTRTIDGDTIYVIVDHGMRIQSAQSLRIAGVNCPELFSGENREAGAAARDFTVAWLKDAQADESNPWPLLITTYKDKQSFNRYVADVHNEASESLAEAIIAANHGEPS